MFEMTKWEQFKRKIKWFKQRWTRGFDDRELWDLDDTFAKFIVPRLIAFRDTMSIHGTPGCLLNSFNPSEKEQEFAALHWRWILDSIIWSLDLHAKDQYPWSFKTDYEREKYTCGMELFAEYFGNLWD